MNVRSLLDQSVHTPSPAQNFSLFPILRQQHANKRIVIVVEYFLSNESLKSSKLAENVRLDSENYLPFLYSFKNVTLPNTCISERSSICCILIFVESALCPAISICGLCLKLEIGFCYFVPTRKM